MHHCFYGFWVLSITQHQKESIQLIFMVHPYNLHENISMQHVYAIQPSAFSHNVTIPRIHQLWFVWGIQFAIHVSTVRHPNKQSWQWFASKVTYIHSNEQIQLIIIYTYATRCNYIHIARISKPNEHHSHVTIQRLHCAPSNCKIWCIIYRPSK
jgi:hypothetical protein